MMKQPSVVASLSLQVLCVLTICLVNVKSFQSTGLCVSKATRTERHNKIRLFQPSTCPRQANLYWRSSRRYQTVSGTSSGQNIDNDDSLWTQWKRKWKQKRQAAKYIVPISTSAVIGSFSLLEILESIREMAERRRRTIVGHAHSVIILAIIRLCRSIAILQTQSEEFTEQVSEIIQQDCSIQNKNPDNRQFWKKIRNWIVSPIVAITACILATVASAVEIWDDLRPGAHHGAALLALSELNYQVRRFVRIVRAKRGIIEKQQEQQRKWWKTPVMKIPVGATIAIAAAIYAGIEVWEDMQPGAHHGVAILALAELSENIHRFQLWNHHRS